MPHPAAPRGGGNVPILKLPRCGGRERPPYRARKPRRQTGKLRRRERLRVGLAPLVKGGWLRRKPQTGGLFRSRQPFPKGCAGGVLCGWRPLPGAAFGAGQSLRPRLAARPPPFDKGGKLQGGACNQPGNRDLDVIANPCRGRFYIGPVCDAANVRGRIWNPPHMGFPWYPGRPGLQLFFRNSSAPGSGLPVWLPPQRAFRG